MCPIKVFISYSRDDTTIREYFITQLFDQSLKEVTELFIDTELSPSVIWDSRIKGELTTSSIIIWLMTPNFMRSEYIRNTEVQLSMQLNKDIFPVLLQPCAYEDLHLPGSYKIYPSNVKPLSEQKDPKSAMQDIRLALKFLVYQQVEKMYKDQHVFNEERSDLATCHLTEGKRMLPGNKVLRWSIYSFVMSAALSYLLYYRILHKPVSGFFAIYLFLLIVNYAIAFITYPYLMLRRVNFRIIDWFLLLVFIIRPLVATVSCALVQLPAALIALWIGPSFILLSILAGAIGCLLLNAEYKADQRPRLQIYIDLAKAGLRPPNGWLIDDLLKD